MKVGSLGEFGLIDMIRARASNDQSGLAMGIGDDAAVSVSPEYGEDLLSCIDMLVEGVHFDLRYMPFYLLGRKALAVNISDIAAMGGEPLHCLISLALPGDTDVDSISDLYRGLHEMCALSGCALAGGDTVSSPGPLVIDVAVVGRVPKGAAWLRRNAAVGDAVLTTGWLGNSGAGLALLQRGGGYTKENCVLTDAHLNPTPRIAESRALRRIGGVRCAMDISDGLGNEINHIARESGTGALIYGDALPVSRECKMLAEALDVDPVHWALYAGEDYELLFTCATNEAHKVSARVTEETGTPVSVIGEITDSKNVYIRSNGETQVLSPKAFDHFRALR